MDPICFCQIFVLVYHDVDKNTPYSDIEERYSGTSKPVAFVKIGL